MQPKNPCIICKGKNPKKYCGRTFCPIYAKSEAISKNISQFKKQDFFGSAPGVFVGRHAYPNLNVGILSPPELNKQSWLNDAPEFWGNNDYQVKRIIGLRSELINSSFKIGVLEKNKTLEMTQEIAMAKRPVDVEINLNKAPNIKMNFTPDLAPTGPNAQLKKAMLTENPKIDSRIDYIVSQPDMRALEGFKTLYNKGFELSQLTKLLSVGTLGMKKNRRLVPTRWSITAIDDNIGKDMIKTIKDKSNYTDYQAFFGSYLGNYYLILTFPEPWSYELFETYLGNSTWNQTNSIEWMTDYESYNGRKSYAENCAGGYYAARLPILEHLKKQRKQGTVLALRFITGEYSCPLGVWVVREATKKSINNKPISFASKELMLKYAELKIKKLFDFDITPILNQSIIIKNLKEQSKLSNFF